MSKIGRYRKLLQNAIETANKYGFVITLEEVIDRYSEPHRHWHTTDHLYDILYGLKELFDEKKINDREYNILLIAAIFHDIIYDPKRQDNEEKSIDYMMNSYDESNKTVSSWRKEEDIKQIKEIILNTKNHDSKEGLSKKFNKLDSWILDSQFIEMLDWENKIYKEFKWAGWKKYKKARIEFLLRSIKDHTHNVINIKNLIDYINKKTPKIGVCYYEIDKLPPKDEYVENIDKISNLFDTIIILIVYNPDNYSKSTIKEYGVLSRDNDFLTLRESNVIEYFSHLNGNVTLIKELKYMNKYHINKEFEDIRTIFI